MAHCPKCLKKLTKRKSDMTYNCVYHGFVRRIYSPKPTLRKEKKDVK